MAKLPLVYTRGMFRLSRTILILLAVVSALTHSACLDLTITQMAEVQRACCEETDHCPPASVSCCENSGPDSAATIVTVRVEQAPQLVSAEIGMPGPRLKAPLQDLRGGAPAPFDTGHLAGQVPLRI